MVASDPLFPAHFLPPDTADKILGETVIEALSKSRTLSIEECVAFFDIEKGKQRYEEWAKNLIERYGYTSRNALFKNMKYCSIHIFEGQIKILPTYYERREFWSGKNLSKSDIVVIPSESLPIKIGAALRLSFKRCRG